MEVIRLVVLIGILAIGLLAIGFLAIGILVQSRTPYAMRMQSKDLRLQSFIDVHRSRIISDLFEWLRIPSISAQPDHAADVVRSGEHCASLMIQAGLEHVTLLETSGAPAVYGQWLHASPDAPSVLVYGHHDVQPVDPIEEWTSPPFEPEILDGECRARGSIDDKGQVLYEIEAVRGLLEVDGTLPVNIKFLIEGEEEIGSPNLEALLHEHRELLKCDVVVVSDTGMFAPSLPSTCVGMRGLLGYDLTIRTAKADLHSGVFGGAVANSTHVLSRIVSSLHDEHGRVQVPGFYDDVRSIGERERMSIDALPFADLMFQELAGSLRLEGEVGHGTLERIGYRPTAEVTGISSGYFGEGIKTIIAADGKAKLTFRLVPDQEPDVIDGLVRKWLSTAVPSGVEYALRPEGAVAPFLTPTDHPAMYALSRTIERVWGAAPLFTREGGSGPEEMLGRVLNAPLLFLGVGLPGDRIHAPNERMVMDQFWKGLLAAGELWHELAVTTFEAPTPKTERPE